MIILLVPLLLDVLACLIHPEYFRASGPKGERPVVGLWLTVGILLALYGVTFFDWFKLLLSIGSPMRGMRSDETQAGCAVSMIRVGCLALLWLVASLAMGGHLAR